MLAFVKITKKCRLHTKVDIAIFKWYKVNVRMMASDHNSYMFTHNSLCLVWRCPILHNQKKYKWDKVFKTGLSKFCGRQPSKNLLVYSWILCPK